MKTIFQIAKNELKTLFFSPVAWLILVVFAVQCSMAFFKVIDTYMAQQESGFVLKNLTSRMFCDSMGFYTQILRYLYLYLPLLTMGLMSKEFSGKTIKFLYSSPITNGQIVMGKFLSMMIYGLILAGVMAVFIVASSFMIDAFDPGPVLTGLLGVYLLISTYCAVGLFMSCLTSYQIVAAIGTIAVLGVLDFFGGINLAPGFLREIAYWLGISGRTKSFINGMIYSQDVLYFIIVSAMFLIFAVIKLQSNRQKLSFSATAGKYLSVVLVACVLGYFTSRPKLEYSYDATRIKQNTLTQTSQDIMNRLDGDLRIAFYCNLLGNRYDYASPYMRHETTGRFGSYVRFRPELKIDEYLYYDEDNAHKEELDKKFPDLNERERAEKIARSRNFKIKRFMTPEQMRGKLDVMAEGNSSGWVFMLGDRKSYLRTFDDFFVWPLENEVTAALRRLYDDVPRVGYLTGHNERDVMKSGDRNCSRFSTDRNNRYSLVTLGLDSEQVSLIDGIPNDIDMLAILDPRQPLSDVELENLKAYISRGGNLLLTGEPDRQEILNPIARMVGVEYVPGRIMTLSENYSPDFIVSTNQASGYRITMPAVAALSYSAVDGFTATALTMSGEESWVETAVVDYTDNSILPELAGGKQKASHVTGLQLEREIGGRQQRIVVLGDSDCLSNSEQTIMRREIGARNSRLAQDIFNYLSDGYVPLNIVRADPPDKKLNLTIDELERWKLGLQYALPAILAILAIVILINRRKK